MYVFTLVIKFYSIGCRPPECVVVATEQKWQLETEREKRRRRRRRRRRGGLSLRELPRINATRVEGVEGRIISRYELDRRRRRRRDQNSIIEFLSWALRLGEGRREQEDRVRASDPLKNGYYKCTSQNS